MAFYGKFSMFWILAVLKNSKICFKKHFFSKKVMKALRKFLLSVEFRSIFAVFSGFYKREFFSENLPTFFFKKSNLWILWGSLLFQSPSAAFLLSLAILKQARFSRKSRIFRKKISFCTLWVILLSQSVSMETFHRLTFTCYNKTYFSVSKSSFFFT